MSIVSRCEESVGCSRYLSDFSRTLISFVSERKTCDFFTAVSTMRWLADHTKYNCVRRNIPVRRATFSGYIIIINEVLSIDGQQARLTVESLARWLTRKTTTRIPAYGQLPFCFRTNVYLLRAWYITRTSVDRRNLHVCPYAYTPWNTILFHRVFLAVIIVSVLSLEHIL